MISQREETFLQKINHINYIVRDHRVHGIRTLPGVTLLDMIYRLSAEYLGTQAVELRQILFKQPIVTSESFDQNILVKFTPCKSHWKVAVSSQKVKNNGTVEIQCDENAECLLYLKESSKNSEKFDVHSFISSAEQSWDIDDIYAMARQVHINHFEFMKTLGMVYRKGDEEIMRLHLSGLAEKYRGKFYAHPAFLDGSTFAGSSFSLSGSEQNMPDLNTPYIPFMIERFCVYKPFPKIIYTYSKRREHTAKDIDEPLDIITNDIIIFDESGSVLAEFDKLTAKRVRTPHSIKKLTLDKDAFVNGEPPNREPYRREETDKSPEIKKNIQSEKDSLQLIISGLKEEIGKELKIDSSEIDINMGFYELGLDSTQLLAMVKELEQKLGEQLYPTLLFEYSNIKRLAEYLAENHEGSFTALVRQGDCGKQDGKAAEDESSLNLLFFQPAWDRRDIGESQGSPAGRRHIIILYNESAPLKEAIRENISTADVMVLDSDWENLTQRLEHKLTQLMDIIRKQLRDKQPAGLLIQVLADSDEEGRYAYTLGGLLKTAYLENPGVHSQIITVDRLYSRSTQTIIGLLRDEALSHENGAADINYREDPLMREYIKRSVRQLREISLNREKAPSCCRESGVYVITGGLGGLGYMVAEHMADKAGVKLALIGRTPADQKSKEKIHKLIQKGAEVLYIECDIGNEKDTEKAFNDIKDKFGSITGVFHCAGVLKDQIIIQKNPSEISDVFNPKVRGLWNLDMATMDEKLDFFVMFSSISSITGNIGQGDYASANAFMDSFAAERQEKVRCGKRCGKTLSVNWPLWSEGGMAVDVQLEQMMFMTSGMKALQTEEGLNAMDMVLALDMEQVVVIYGEKEKIYNNLRTHMAYEKGETENSIKSPVFSNSPAEPEKSFASQEASGQDIAIIGVAGRYPMADTIDQFYRNFREGKDCITGFPKDRWKGYQFSFDVEQFYKYGGFIDGIDRFDPLFFNISPRQAEIMDPQARLFLETAWKACEDAGFFPDRTEHHFPSSSDRSVGVFVGVFWNHYELYSAEITQRGVPVSFGTSAASIPNMVSYCMNFHGPSMAVDTMCSSALTSIHLACESIKRGECSYALAGGVNLVTHPNKYMFLKQAEFLSSDGRCRSFGEGGDGYVPSEGVGAVLLTSLECAEREGYPIYAVIKGSALNHVGKTAGATIPDPVAQSEVIGQALEKSGIDPRTISYVEAHGTGTSLGDPIEVQGLKKAYGKWTHDKSYCAIGSSKSNIGHLEAAAGIAGLTKLLLQFKYKELFPSLHSEKLNPYIPFDDTPFHVEHQLKEWVRPEIEINGVKTLYPRRAGISSFGANGSNAHIILEEYMNRADTRENTAIHETGPIIVPLSAKNEGDLKAYMKSLMEFLREKTAAKRADGHMTDSCHGAGGIQGVSLTDLAYTFSTGREAMGCRAAFVVSSIDELLQKLELIIKGKENIDNCYRGVLKKDRDLIAGFALDEDMREAVDKWILKGKIIKLAELWVKGLNLDWKRLYGNKKVRRISLPGYPFAGESYWIPGIISNSQAHPIHYSNVRDGKEDTRRAWEAKPQESEIHTFEEIWQDEALGDASPNGIETLLCFVSNSQNQRSIVEAVQAWNTKTRVIFISQGSLYQKHSMQNYSVGRADRDTYREAFRAILEDYGKVDAALYLWALEDSSCIKDISCIFNILQAAVSEKMKLGKCLLIGQYEDELERCYLESWIGFERSLKLVLPDLKLGVTYSKNSEQSADSAMKSWMERLLGELENCKTESVFYKDGKRQVCRVKPTIIPVGRSVLKAGGTYLITGGCGGLGLLFAHYFAKAQPVNLVLTGRSGLDERKQSEIKALEALGNRVMYLQADICDVAGMKKELCRVKECFGKIDGVIHGAGIPGGKSIFENDIQSFQKVLQPKIAGTLALDEVLAGETLDFICYFSSSSAVLGDFGSCDYSIGNRFQMAYANYRNERLHGKAAAINWPLWRDGGMGSVDGGDAGMYLKSSGQRLLEAEEGLGLFEGIMSMDKTHQLILAGQYSRIEGFLKLAKDGAHAVPDSISGAPIKGQPAKMNGTGLKQHIEQDLKVHISKLLKISQEKLEMEENFADFGFDSVSLGEFAVKMSKYYGMEIIPALLYGYSTIEKLAQYFLNEHYKAMEEFYGRKEERQLEVPMIRTACTAHIASSIPLEKNQGSFEHSLESTGKRLREPIAIIGMSGRFPGADTVAKLWENLKNGRECITEVPADRWDWRKYYGDPHKEPGKTNSRWGGFMSDIDCFDPLFFGISPIEAEYMDPQQRLFLQEAWHALEDAGYMGAAIRGKNCGVYVGVEEGQYGALAGWNGQVNSNQNATLSARIAYALDLKGPNLALTAACSSGLAAVHQACLALRQGDCEMALVGGISLMVSPLTHLALSQADMLSPDGKCSVFGSKANGLVPGEAVAVVLLKPLSKAISDKDNIYGCIRASGVNYDGKTNGITSPSPLSQADLIKNIYDRYYIDPSNIQFVMTHSVGSKSGDPIEFEALKNAFNKYSGKRQYCVMGSIKPLIGHTFAASGVVSLISMLLAMRHNTIPGTYGYESENPHINFIESPFTVDRYNQKWDALNNQPRMGAVSTAGISGTNAHAVIEEYVPEAVNAKPSIPADKEPVLFVLSAKSREALKAYAEKFMDFIGEHGDISLTDMAYTLQVGREAMDCRLAFEADSKEALAMILKGFIESGTYKGAFTGSVREHKGAVKPFEAGENAGALIEAGYKNKNLMELAELWVKGLKIDWECLCGYIKPKRISLPGYPFAKEHYWAIGNNTGDRDMEAAVPAVIHPLLHQNTSNLSRQRFTSIYTGQELFLADHVVKGQRVLPGVACLEMARAAVDTAAEGAGKGFRIKNVVWARPIKVDDQPVQVHIGLWPGDNGRIDFEIYSGNEEPGEGHVVHSQGSITPGSIGDAPVLDLAALREQCKGGCISQERCYEAYRAVGIDYGPGCRGVEAIYAGVDGERRPMALAKLSLPSALWGSAEQFVLHPCVMDSALHASIGLMGEVDGDSFAKLSLPFALQEIEIFSSCMPEMWALIRPGHNSGDGGKVRKLDIDICDETGKMCVRIKGFSTRTLEDKAGLPAVPRANKLVDVHHSAGEKKGGAAADGLFRERAADYLKKLLSSVIKLPVSRIEAGVPMEMYGIDSLMVIQLTNRLEKTFGSLPKTLFYEYQTIEELTGYFIEAYYNELEKLLNTGGSARNAEPCIQAGGEAAAARPVPDRSDRRSASIPAMIGEGKDKGTQDIAIIGLAGRYPGAKNIKEFWENLQCGKNCIAEIPKERWDYSLYFDEDRNKAGKIYCKWGGFLDDVDKFDPLFFNISPREAEIMDPQERLFLQCVFEALEDAGYTREALSKHRGLGLDGNVGVYVGVMYEEYQFYGIHGQLMDKPFALSGNPSTIANRVSYFCNFHGPSMAVDTACSSSLTAVHLACQSLQQGSCELAIAGGVNVSIHPNKYLMLAQGKFASSKGLCESFGRGGDGYVPGEGVGAVLLKPLDKAVADGDHIYGIIKGTAINHGGKTNGYTVPNPNAQAAVIGNAFKQAGVDPRTISYLEAHGTGTSLGDPIEIAGLTKAFQLYTADKQFCSIGSVKSNIGHCESAAGIAGLTKILLQLSHGKLAPSLHSKELNPNIDFINTPFVVQQELVGWERPVIEIDGKTVEYPRRAGISAFGAGGSNAHVVIEEYIPEEDEKPKIVVNSLSPAVIVLSARNEEQLLERARQLLKAMGEEQVTDTGLGDMAYTLQVGREAMEERIGMVVESIRELEEKLLCFIENWSEVPGLYKGTVKNNKDANSLLTALTNLAADEGMQEMVCKWIVDGKYGQLLNLWVKGFNFDWNKLYDGMKPRRISLPAYPFEKARYWVPRLEATMGGEASVRAQTAAIHPLLHQNTSDFYEHRFSSVFTGEEFFLADHRINGRKVLPGAAYLEMMRAAAVKASGLALEDTQGIRLKNVIWVQPVMVSDKPVEVHTGIFLEDNGDISCEIYSGPLYEDSESVIHSQGRVILADGACEPQTLDMEVLMAQCNRGGISSARCYEAFSKMGIDYGLGHQGLESVYMGQGQVLAKLALPDSVLSAAGWFVLHPSLIDSALQASMCLMAGSIDDNSLTDAVKPIRPALPFALQELEVFGKCTPVMWAFARYGDGEVNKTGVSARLRKIDIDLCDESGRVCVRIKGLSAREPENSEGTADLAKTTGTLLLEPCWREQETDCSGMHEEGSEPLNSRHIVISCGLGEAFKEKCENHLKGVQCITLQSRHEDIGEQFRDYTMKVFDEIKGILEDKPKGRVVLRVVIPVKEEQQLLSGICGLLRAARLENPKLEGQLIEVCLPGEANMDEAVLAGVMDMLMKDVQNPGCDRVRYVGGKWQAAYWKEVEAPAEEACIPWKDQGVYLITGGAGGLGLIFAREIAHKVKNGAVILAGRSHLDGERQAQLEQLKALGLRVQYRKVDVTRKKEVQELILGIRKEFGGLNGIIHSAGIVRDNFIIKKTGDEFREVLDPKVAGLVNLDEAAGDIELDFFVLFSSVAGAVGNTGQADYSAANAFMDAYAVYCNSLVERKQRHGKTLSINWPLWEEGGMQVDEQTRKMMELGMGMTAMGTQTGINAFYRGLASGKSQVMALEGDIEKLRHCMGMNSTELKKIDDSNINNKAVQIHDEFYMRLSEEISNGKLSEEQVLKIFKVSQR